MPTKEKLDVRDEIITYLKSIERNLRWLCTKTGFNYNTMYSTFVQKVIELSEEKLAVINALLETNFKK